MLATYGANAISARLLMYSWAHVPVPSLSHTLATHANAGSARLPMYSWVCISVPSQPSAMDIGEPYMPPVDKYPIYA